MLSPFAIMGCRAEPSGYKTWTVRGDLTSAEVNAIQAAMPELRKREPSWKSYSVEVIETDRSYIIEFWLPQHTQVLNFQDRSDPQHPEVVAEVKRKPGALAVELSKDTLEVIGAFYER
jgi:hypothetical protein